LSKEEYKKKKDSKESKEKDRVDFALSAEVIDLKY